jgi:2-keto-4-pentenoate hydratase/2-oxohepta-3-ene-1,7-dioic acid hydratase in catechol pathway
VRFCRFDRDRLGVIEGSAVVDVTSLFDLWPVWPPVQGDWIARQLVGRIDEFENALSGRKRLSLDAVRLEFPLVSPGKIVGAPVNYRAHQAEAQADAKINFGRKIAQIGEIGLFLKAASALSGPADPVRLSFSERRNDHEVELVVVIGKEGRSIPRERALEHVLGYSVGLDMTVRGPEFPTFRKSVDTYAVVGPWIVTADELPDPSNLKLTLKVNGEERQNASTRDMIFDVPALIEYASKFYTLYPGDLIFTGTPEGVSEVKPGDILEAAVEKVGEMRIAIAPDYTA